MRKGLMFAFVLLVAGCQGPSDGPGSGWIEINGVRSDIVECETREDFLTPGEPRGRVLTAVDASGRRVSATEFYDDSPSIVSGSSGTQCETGTLTSQAGAWSIEAECSGVIYTAEISECDFVE